MRKISTLSFQRSEVSTLFRTQPPLGLQRLFIGEWRALASRGMTARTVIEHFDGFTHGCVGISGRVQFLPVA